MLDNRQIDFLGFSLDPTGVWVVIAAADCEKWGDRHFKPQAGVLVFGTFRTPAICGPTRLSCHIFQT